ncbi:[NiFe]-hydrogenase assembly chaperone HybE [Alisedimentitalea sp. MJ-SS2]|uniref:[NiFe]-hydrogenase assembly chaperone HybE n=1 Tax=Aliisedimentitalea sp. MJ-SS2 TaxID=3049795 RepID=UPI002909DCFE|nr:[NiFe]-hydrogenase assembly chaperone HybE [Alisedimentitalea sp. MJ-SS2]MDU8929651.1 [NiFe]-hydrogenase assembly chaperone HybE [Alisedimentitalea sp. MJ-SS2]
MKDRGAILRDRLETLYGEIEVTRMKGVPILNPALSVAAIGFEPWQDYHFGVLLTPWFMNFVLLPKDAETFAQSQPSVGDKRRIQFPAGQVEFIVGHEDVLGYSLSCSLFSPVFEFSDQEAAVETAQAALTQVLAASDEDEDGDNDAEMRNLWAGKLPVPEDIRTPDAETEPPRHVTPSEISRRDLFRGASSRRVAEGQP